jgi:hypothetical protein
MIDLDSGIAHAVLQRSAVLSEERHTRDAQHVMSALRSPRGSTTGAIFGKIPRQPAAFSLGALVRERADLRQVHLLLKSGRPADVAEAREIASAMLSRVGPNAPAPSLDGETRLSFLSDLATAFSHLSWEEESIELSEFLLDEIGAPAADPASLRAFMRSTARGSKNQVRITQQLQNIALRRLRVGQLDLLAGTLSSARDNLAAAEAAVAIALQHAEEETAASEHDRVRRARLIRARRAILGRVRLEQAMLSDPGERPSRLAAVRCELEQVVAETDSAGTSSPPVRIMRHAALAGAICEQALEAERAGDNATARRLGRMSYVLSAPYVALHEHDADERLAYIVRYAHACRLIGRDSRGAVVLRRSRDRVAVFYGMRHAAVAGLDRLLAQIER